jgi:plastocyanin
VNAIINQLFLTQTSFDSASPGGSAVLVRQFEREGDYEIELARDDKRVAAKPLVVGRAHGAERAARASEDEAPQTMALDIAALLRPSATAPEASRIAPGTHVSFTAPRPSGHYVLVKSATADGGEEFDSRKLDSSCVFAATLVRPGTYSLTNAITGARGRIVVTYPQVGSAPYRPPAPLSVQCTQDGFGAEELTLSPGQGIIFRFATESRVQIELVEPDDGPAAPKDERAQG